MLKTVAPKGICFISILALPLTSGCRGGDDEEQVNEVEVDTSTVYIGVIDSGVDIHHPEIAPYLGHSLETFDGLDNTCNGYVDDVYGIDARTDVRGPSVPPGEECEGLSSNENPTPGPGVEPHFIFDEEAFAENGEKVIVGVDGDDHGTSMNNTMVQLIRRFEEQVERPIRIANCRANSAPDQLDPEPDLLSGMGAVLRKDLVQCLDYFADLRQRGLNIVAVNQSSGFPVNFKRSFRAITGIAPAFMGLVGVSEDMIPPYKLHSYYDDDSMDLMDDVEQGIRKLGDLDVTYVVAAGNFLENNDGNDDRIEDGVHSFYPAMANLSNQITVASTTPDNEYWFDNDHAWPGNGWLGTGHGKETVHLAAPSYTTPNATIGSFGTHIVNEQGELEEADEFLYTEEELKKDLGLAPEESLESLGVRLQDPEGIYIPRGDFHENNEAFETSPAAAYVSALVALMKAKDMSLTSDEILEILIDTGINVEVFHAAEDSDNWTDTVIETQSNKTVNPKEALKY